MIHRTVFSKMLLVLTLISASKLAHAQCTAGDNEVCLFAGANATGASVKFVWNSMNAKGGRYPTGGNFGSVGNDQVSSVVVGKFAWLRLCSDAYLYGSCDDFKGNGQSTTLWNLSGTSVGDNRASSARVTPIDTARPPTWNRQILADALAANPANQTGDYVYLPIGTYNTPTEMGLRNDTLTAAGAPPGGGGSITVCNNDNLDGGCINLNLSVGNLSGWGWNDAASSITLN